MTEQQPDRNPPNDGSPEPEERRAEEAESDDGAEAEQAGRWTPGGPLTYDDPDVRPPPPEPGKVKQVGQWTLRQFTKQFTITALMAGGITTCITTGLKAFLPQDEQNGPEDPMESLGISTGDLRSALESRAGNVRELR